MIRACLLADLPAGESLRLDLDVPVALFHTDDGEIYALDDTCSHQDASLADGWLEGCAVECPLHASRFDLRTGRADVPPAKLPVRTHQVTVVDGEVFVTLSADRPNLPPDVPAAVSAAASVAVSAEVTA